MLALLSMLAQMCMCYIQKMKRIKILEFIKNELVAYCQNGHYICDQIGFGANQIK